jgi:hypothetical protein
MAVSRFVHSCNEARNYPNNLIDPGPTCPSVLKEYAQRFNDRKNDDKMPLFCLEGSSKVELHEYREENGQRSFRDEKHPTCLRQLQQLKRRLPGAIGDIQTDSPCIFIFVGAESSRHALDISPGMALWILTFFQVMPPFLDFLFAFGQKVQDIDFHFSGFREDTRIESSLRRTKIDQLNRKGRDFQICYNLKTFEKKPGLRLPWSSRQAVIFHSFDVENGHACWIAIKANNLLRDRLKEVCTARLANDPDAFDATSKRFASTLASHLVVIEWSGQNWRWYLNDIEEQVVPLRRRAMVDSVARHIPADTSVDTQDPGYPLNDLPPSRMTLRTLTSGSRMTTRSQVAQVSPRPQPAAPPPASVMVDVPESPQEPPNVPFEYDLKFQSQPSDEEQSMRYQIEELQDAQALGTRVTEASLVLKSNIKVLAQIDDYYEQLARFPDLPAPLMTSMDVELPPFLRRVRSVRSDLEMHLERLNSVSTLVRECKELLYGIVEYQAMQANQRFANEAKHSAVRMERMTKRMQDMTIRTTLETVLMRIITVVTVFFLPGTFVSTLMSTSIVTFTHSDSGITSGAVSGGALKFFLCLSFSLMAATFLAGSAIWWRAVSTSITV